MSKRFGMQFDYVPEKGEKFSSGKLYRVRLATFVPARVQIERMIKAGNNLRAIREQFDYEGNDFKELDKLNLDPTREVGFDYNDADDLFKGVEQRYDKRIIEAAEKAAEKIVSEEEKVAESVEK